MNEDPWKHRSSGMKCSNCMWFVLKASMIEKVIPMCDTEDKQEIEPGSTHPLGTVGFAAVNQSELGRCRRHAPTMNGYPAVFGNDWCGDHKLDETKI